MTQVKPAGVDAGICLSDIKAARRPRAMVVWPMSLHPASPCRTTSRREALAIAAGGLAMLAAAPAASRRDAGIPVLAYHRFDAVGAGPTTVRLSSFEAQIAWLAAHGRKVVSLRAALAERRRAGGAPVAGVTADDGHVSIYAHLYPQILRARLPVTLFVYPSAISNAAYALTWAQLREMQASGLVEVQSHTYWHPNFNVERRRRPGDVDRLIDSQLVRSRTAIEDRLGRTADLLAWPFGIVDAGLEDAARRAGYAAAFAYAGGPMTGADDLYALPRIPISDADRGAGFGEKLRVRTGLKEEP